MALRRWQLGACGSVRRCRRRSAGTGTARPDPLDRRADRPDARRLPHSAAGSARAADAFARPRRHRLAVQARPRRQPVRRQPRRDRRRPPGGAADVEPAAPAADPPIDCFYVYPTVSRQKTINANLTIDPEERAVAAAQAARFSQVCRVYAPMYPQLTLAAIARPERDHATRRP